MKLQLFLLIILQSLACNSQNDMDLLQFSPSKLYSQEYIDSLSMDYATGENNFKVRMSSFKKVLESDKKLKGWIHYYSSMSSILYSEQKLDSAIFYGLEGLRVFENTKDNRNLDEHLMIRCYSNLGGAYFKLRNYDQSLNFYNKAYKLSNKYTFKWKNYILMGMAENQLAVGNYASSLKYRLILGKDSIFLNQSKASVTHYGSVAALYQEMKNYDSSNKFFKIAIARAKEVNYLEGLPSLYGSLASLKIIEKKEDSAVFYYRQALRISKTLPEKEYYKGYNDYLLYYQAFVDNYYGSVVDATHGLRSLVDNLKSYNFIETDERSLLKSIIVLIFKIDSTKSSINFEKMVSDVLDLIEQSFDNEFKKDLQIIKVNSELQEQNNSIKQLYVQQQNQKTIINQRTIITVILLILIILLMVSSFFFFRQRRLNESYIVNNLQQRLLLSQLNPHFLFNSLNTVIILSKTAPDKLSKYVAKLGELLRSILENSREEFVCLDEEISTLSTYLQLQSNFSSNFNFDIEIDPSLGNINEILLPPMTIQPFIENSIQHGLRGGEQDEIKILFKAEGENIYCFVEDNGKGYTKSIDENNNLKNRSLSGQIMKERLDLLSKKFKIKAYYSVEHLKLINKTGTRVKLVLPLLRDN